MPVDALGHSYEPSSPPQRVVSLVPSLTESLFDLGAGDSVVGITDFCIFPREPLANLRRVGGTKNPDISAIRALRPDLVYLNLEENLRRHGEAIATFAPTFATEPKGPEDVLTLLEELTEIHSLPESPIAREIRSELSVRGNAPRFTFAVAIWRQPWMWCGADTYVSNLVSSVGGVNVLAGKSRYPTAGVEEIASLDPDVILLPDEPYAFASNDADALRTVLRARVIGPFPGHLVTWHGTRTLLGLRFLRSVLSS